MHIPLKPFTSSLSASPTEFIPGPFSSPLPLDFLSNETLISAGKVFSDRVKEAIVSYLHDADFEGHIDSVALADGVVTLVCRVEVDAPTIPDGSGLSDFNTDLIVSMIQEALDMSVRYVERKSLSFPLLSGELPYDPVTLVPAV